MKKKSTHNIGYQIRAKGTSETKYSWAKSPQNKMLNLPSSVLFIFVRSGKWVNPEQARVAGFEMKQEAQGSLLI